MPVNEFGQTIGETVAASPLLVPDLTVLEGKTVRIERINAKQHLDDIWEFYGPTARKEDWTYLPIEPFSDKADLQALLEGYEKMSDPYHLAIIDKTTDKVVGTFSLMRVDASSRVCEMGWVVYSPVLQRSRLATEAQYLVMTYVFEHLHYRRYEWKCDSLNVRSRRAAERLGFQFEGRFRQVTIYKGRSRDTDWLSVIDSEWETCKKAFDLWLDDSNFNNGEQIKGLAAIRAELSQQ